MIIKMKKSRSSSSRSSSGSSSRSSSGSSSRSSSRSSSSSSSRSTSGSSSSSSFYVSRYIYHFTLLSNLKSILDTGLGAKIGKGIDLEKAKLNMVYALNFDPYVYFDFPTLETNEQVNQDNLLRLLVHMLLGPSETQDIAILKVDTKDLSEKNFTSEENNNAVLYTGVIPSKYIVSYACFHLSEISVDKDSIKLDENLYFKDIPCDIPTKEVEDLIEILINI